MELIAAHSRGYWRAVARSAGVLECNRNASLPDVIGKLRSAGLRPTQQRLALARVLFGSGDRHLTAEMLFEEATRAKVSVSLATVYNTLNQLTDAGLLRQVSVDGAKTYFDTNVSDHYHFYIENKYELIDFPVAHASLRDMPEVPDGYEISRIDLVVRLRKID
uniref:Ferric uptake regulation protein n=1 Tax=Rhodopseudomonas palustris (strain BisA53) TaxID=316055 RepID=Q07IM0_RHOP5